MTAANKILINIWESQTVFSRNLKKLFVGKGIRFHNKLGLKLIDAGQENYMLKLTYKRNNRNVVDAVMT